MLNDSLPWTEKHRASNFNEILGQDNAIEQIKIFLKQFPKKRALILHGPPGTGKTALVHATANSLNAEIIEMNASDFRNKAKIQEIIKPALEQRSLFKSNKIILIDEVDGISAQKDRGGLTELLGLIEKSAYPIFITANDIWDRKFSLLRQRAQTVQLKELDYKIITQIVKKISEKENLLLDSETITQIAVKSKGDARAAINDLQLLSKMDSENLSRELDERNKEKSIFEALQRVFKTSKIDEEMLRVFDEVDVPLDEIFLWIEENLPKEYKGEELAKAFEVLALADRFKYKTNRNRYWRFMVYQRFFLGPAIAAVKKYNRVGWTSYEKPKRILKIWIHNQRMAKKKTIAEKYAKHCHISIKTALKDFKTLLFILSKPSVQAEIGLTPEEREYILTHTAL